MTKTVRKGKTDNDYLKLLIENATEGLVLVGNSETIIACNQTFLNIFGFENREEVIGKTVSIIHASEEKYKSFLKKISSTIHVQKPFKFQWELSTKDESSLPCEINVTAIKDEKGSIVSSVLAIRDITQWKKHERNLARKATHDPLTGLPNRILFYDRLELALAHAQRNGEHLAVLFLDLDFFKDINYKYGYSIGDLLLKEVGAKLKTFLRKGDTLARFGNDEYVMLLPGLSKKENAGIVADKILKIIDAPFLIGGHNFSITASIGIAIFPEDGDAHEELIKNADIAMFFMQKMGRNGFRFYSAVTT